MWKKYESLPVRSVGGFLGAKTVIWFGNVKKRRLKVLPTAKFDRMTWMGLRWVSVKIGDKLWRNTRMLPTVPTSAWQSKSIWRATSSVVFRVLFWDNMEIASLDQVGHCCLQESSQLFEIFNCFGVFYLKNVALLCHYKSFLWKKPRIFNLHLFCFLSLMMELCMRWNSISHVQHHKHIFLHIMGSACVYMNICRHECIFAPLEFNIIFQNNVLKIVICCWRDGPSLLIFEELYLCSFDRTSRQNNHIHKIIKYSKI